MAYKEKAPLKTLVMRNILRKSGLDARHQIVFACFLATMVMYMERVGFSIAFTEMAKTAGLDAATTGTILSSFYWGYGLSQIPGGWAAQRWGGRNTLALSFALWSTAVLVTPSSGKEIGMILCVRVLVGVAQGLIIPSIHTVLAQWIMPQERARAVSLTTSGMYMGSAAAMALLPSLAARAGPRALLRIVGLTGLSWLALWLAVGRSPPPRSGYLPLAAGHSQRRSASGMRQKPPWLRMLRHPAVWAIIVNNFTFHFAFYVVMNWMPTYFDQVLKVNLKDAGSSKMVPYLAMFACSNLGGWAGDHLITQRAYPVEAARKTVNTVGFVGTSLALLAMPAARTLRGGTMATTATLAAAAFARGGFSVNHMDIAPAHAGVLMGLSNSAGTLSGVIGVAVTGVMLKHSDGMAGWWAAFLLCAAQCLAGSVFFLFFAKGERLFGEQI
ncbi:hypothetical protein WJX73_003076 [Symbiochloris irregularis]|uniref:Major facilitator superfamily (MFS) profile domain-containing protein n=1 Tax=Symbiochloris irregularis TaxID=706552 RepID=A0AAW1P8X2_9CHLO